MGAQLANAGAGAEAYVVASWLFLRLLGLIYAIAFASLGTQILGLVGRHGIWPAAELLKANQRFRKGTGFRRLPTLCWWNSTDTFLRFLCWGGAGLSLLLAAGIAPAPMLVLLWIFYLSLFTVGRVFLGYQWDVLLLETGFLAIFLAPWRWWDWPPAVEPSPVIRWLLYWLLFRLLFSSGVVKLRSGDRTWRNFIALKYHYETQPLPNRLSWYFHQLPDSFHKLSATILFAAELVVPLLIFAPPPLRYVAAAATLLLMLLIIATGNYCFFNLLGLALCVLLCDDAVWFSMADFLFGRGHTPGSTIPLLSSWPWWIVTPIAAVIALLSVDRVVRLFRYEGTWPPTMEKFFGCLAPFCLVNGYGLFAVMTTARPEIIVQGSHDGVTWLPYEFKWKPGDVTRAPRQVAPHQPRLDWQMWFAALGDFRSTPWFSNFLTRLVQGEREVLALLENSPFPDVPPRYVRAMLYDYRFTGFTTRRQTGAWWRRERKWLYSPVFSLRGREDAFIPPEDRQEDSERH